MNLETSKTILKVIGIINLVIGILGAALGLLAIAGGGLLGVGAAGNASGDYLAEIQAVIGIAIFGGLIILALAIIKIVEGVCDIKSSKDINKIMPAWVLAIIELLICAYIVFDFVTKKTFDRNSIIMLVGTVLISVPTFVVTTIIKKAAGK